MLTSGMQCSCREMSIWSIQMAALGSQFKRGSHTKKTQFEQSRCYCWALYLCVATEAASLVETPRPEPPLLDGSLLVTHVVTYNALIPAYLRCTINQNRVWKSTVFTSSYGTPPFTWVQDWVNAAWNTLRCFSFLWCNFCDSWEPVCIRFYTQALWKIEGLDCTQPLPRGCASDVRDPGYFVSKE